MMESLWDLKLQVVKQFDNLFFYHDGIPMGFETR